ncbi:MAG: 30S ribosomal protein S20, partial [Planctomycetota bacterium]
VDKAAKKNIIHDNAAARKKSQLRQHVDGLKG